jgi:hypothetical protein
MNPGAELRQQWLALQSQWLESSRLRLGCWLVLLLLGVWGVQVLADWRDRARADAARVEVDLARWKAVPELDVWKARADEVGSRSLVVQALIWREPEIGLAEAAFQDWIRATAGRLGLPVRQIRVTRVETDAKAVGGSDSQAGAALPSQPLPAGYGALRARVVFDLKRTPLMTFLSECLRSERAVVVERLSLRFLSQPMTAEVDLRVLVAKPGPAIR